MTGVSDVNIRADDLVAESRPLVQEPRPIVLIYVGTMAQLYKAPHILIDAVAACVREGLDLKLVLVGDGKHRAELEAQANAHGLGERVVFRGQFSSSAQVRDELDQADLFVLPSFQEGLPRAMVEAMARALPCIGSTVGGIPELLPAEDMVQPGDVDALAGKIREVTTNPQRMQQMSQRNLATAADYQFERLREKRNAFYQYVRDQTQAWLRQRHSGLKPSKTG
jgi:glycosyltransferase involved in cell wall biosynthesis